MYRSFATKSTATKSSTKTPNKPTSKSTTNVFKQTIKQKEIAPGRQSTKNTEVKPQKATKEKQEGRSGGKSEGKRAGAGSTKSNRGAQKTIPLQINKKTKVVRKSDASGPKQSVENVVVTKKVQTLEDGAVPIVVGKEEDEQQHESIAAEAGDVIDAEKDDTKNFNKKLHDMLKQSKQKGKSSIVKRGGLGVMFREMDLEEAKKLFNATEDELANLNVDSKIHPTVLEEIMDTEELEVEDENTLQDSGRAIKPASAPVTKAEKWSNKIKLDSVIEILREERIKDLALIDMSEKCSWTKWFIIATGRSQRHNRAVADRLIRKFRQEILNAGLNAIVEGRETEWMLVDMGPMVVHLFTQDERLDTNLEGLWLLRTNDPELMDDEEREAYEDMQKELNG